MWSGSLPALTLPLDKGTWVFWKKQIRTPSLWIGFTVTDQPYKAGGPLCDLREKPKKSSHHHCYTENG